MARLLGAVTEGAQCPSRNTSFFMPPCSEGLAPPAGTMPFQVCRFTDPADLKTAAPAFSVPCKLWGRTWGQSRGKVSPAEPFLTAPAQTFSVSCWPCQWLLTVHSKVLSAIPGGNSRQEDEEQRVLSWVSSPSPQPT